MNLKKKEICVIKNREVSHVMALIGPPKHASKLKSSDTVTIGHRCHKFRDLVPLIIPFFHSADFSVNLNGYFSIDMDDIA